MRSVLENIFLVVMIIVVIFVSYRIGYKLRDREAKSEKIRELQTKSQILQATFLKDMFFNIDKYEVLFPSELVKYIIKDISFISYNKFYETILLSLKTKEDELPKNTKAVILRTISYKPEENFINYVFEPIINS